MPVKMLERIFVVMDKPKHDQTALEHALDIQAATGAHLHLGAFCWHPMYGQTDIFEAHQRRMIKREIVRERRDWLLAQLRDERCLAADITTDVVWTDDIAAWTVDFVTKNRYDTVIKSVHPSRTLIHTPLDWQLLQDNPAATLLATKKRRKTSGNILAALDLRHDDKKHQTLNARVLEAAHQLAAIRGGRVHCVYAVEYSKILSDLDIINLTSVKKKAAEKSAGMLERLLADYPMPKARIHRPLGKVGQAVANTAKKINADLLVMGTSARRTPGALILGNSAERVLARTPCDVLTVRP